MQGSKGRSDDLGKSNQEGDAEWQKKFILDNEEDFPGLPNSKDRLKEASLVTQKTQKAWAPSTRPSSVR